MYKLYETDSSMFDEFYRNATLTFEGCTLDNGNIADLEDWLNEHKAVAKNDCFKIYHYTGADMNDCYNLNGDNAYPADLNIISMLNTDLKEEKWPDEIDINRFELDGRWFKDIINNKL